MRMVLIMANGFYKWYLTTEHWKTFRLHALEEHGKICKDCGATDVSLHVHHLTYANIWEETLEDVVILCHSCHWARHPEKRSLKCTHDRLGKTIGYGYDGLTFYWHCTKCMEVVASREPDEKEKQENEKYIVKQNIYHEKESIKQAIRDEKKREKEALRKEKVKL